MATQRQPLSHYLALQYPYMVVPDEGSYFIRFADLPGCMTQVDDPADIAAMAEEIRTLWIEGEHEDGHDIPEPATTAYSGKFVVRLPKSLHRDLAQNAEREGVSLNAYTSYLLAGRHATARASNAGLASESSDARVNVQESNAGSSEIRPQSAEVCDTTLTCRDCGNPFTWTSAEQLFFREKELINNPARCPNCRSARKAMLRLPDREQMEEDEHLIFRSSMMQTGRDATVELVERLGVIGLTEYEITTLLQEITLRSSSLEISHEVQ